MPRLRPCFAENKFYGVEDKCYGAENKFYENAFLDILPRGTKKAENKFYENAFLGSREHVV